MPFLGGDYVEHWVGDELGAFYLDRWATASESNPIDTKTDIGDPAAELWKTRNLDDAKKGYMELVFAAYEQGVRDVVIDMSPAMQPGINQAIKIYHDSINKKSSEATFLSLSCNDVATPMDAVVQQAAQSFDMRVHALNAGLTGIATLFREAQGTTLIPTSGTHQERIDAYMKVGFDKDKMALERLLRRPADSFELEVLQAEMKHRLSDKELKDEEIISNEKGTADLIHDTILDKPFLGFFQNARLFQSSKDLDGLLRTHYGDNTVVRISMGSLDGTNHTKSAQYSIDVHKLKGCVLTPQHRSARHDSKLG